MEVATVTLPYKSRKTTFHLWFMGDVHLGTCLCDEENLERTICDILLDPFGYVFLMGDLCEWIPKGEWRWREDNVAEWVDRSDVGKSEQDRIVELLKPLAQAHKILGAIQGNHEMEIEDTWNQAVHRHVCEELAVTNLGYMALVRLQFKWKRQQTGDNHRIDLFLHHGFGGGRSDGADINRFNEYMRDYAADWYVAGHTHRREAIKVLQHSITNKGALGARVRLAGRSGTFLRTVMQGHFGYPEKTALRPLATGALCITYSPECGDAVANI